MMDLWWQIRGWCRVRLTAADPMCLLRELAEVCDLEQIQWDSGLSLTAAVCRSDLGDVKKTARKRQAELEVLEERGLPCRLKVISAYPAVFGCMAILLALSLWIPSRIFFFSVEGNEAVPADLILEQAQACGMKFGMSRRQLRSEELKNRLLKKVPQLSWAGVNTRGCTARISVRERQLQPKTPMQSACNIVAAKNGIITDFVCTRGSALITTGQAVRKGDLLFSGITDLGRYHQITGAAGEVFARTASEVRAVLPRNHTAVGKRIGTEWRLSVIFGKKRINLYSDSGILHPGCGKMERVIPLRLPGGLELPAALVVSELIHQEWLPDTVPPEQAEGLLQKSVDRQILEPSVAAQILDRKIRSACSAQVYSAEGTVFCREMIGRTAGGIFVEDDIEDDRTNRECGAG